MSSTRGTNTVYFFDEADCIFASQLTFQFLSVQFRFTLRVCREVSLTVSDDQRELGECVLFPTPPVGWTCTSLLPVLGIDICALHVCYILALFGAYAQTVASLVPIALRIEH